MFGRLAHHLLKRAQSKGSTKRSTGRLFDSVSIHLIAGGFELHEAGRTLGQVKWADILEAKAFKRDLFTTDLICVACRIGARTDEDRGVVVHEEMPGFNDWMAALPARLPGIEADWYSSVMLPPFKTCERLIWRRDDSK